MHGTDSAADVQQCLVLNTLGAQRLDEEASCPQRPPTSNPFELAGGETLVEDALDPLALALAHGPNILPHVQSGQRAVCCLNPGRALHYTPAGLEPRTTAVILDFGGVLGLPQDPVRAANMASLCGRTMEEFSLLYQRDRLELDRGTLSTEEYWARILRASGVLPSSDMIARIEEEDSLGWTRINERVVAWSRELRAAGYATAILSNMPFDKLSYMRKNPAFDFIDEFPVTVFSCNHGLVKPEPAIYSFCLDLLRKRPDECLFLDDSPVNVAGGLGVGIPTLLFRTADEALPALAETWDLPVRALVDHHRV